MKVMRLFLDKYLFKTVIDIARSLIVVVIDLLIVTLCIQYFYAALGFELFGSTHVNKVGVLAPEEYSEVCLPGYLVRIPSGAV